MDDIIVRYRNLIQLLEKEHDEIGKALDGELLKKYQQILNQEMEMVRKHMHLFYILN